MASWHTPYKKPNGERALTRKRARALNTAMKLECVSKSVRYMRSHKKQRTRLNKTSVAKAMKVLRKLGCCLQI